MHTSETPYSTVFGCGGVNVVFQQYQLRFLSSFFTGKTSFPKLVTKPKAGVGSLQGLVFSVLFVHCPKQRLTFLGRPTLRFLGPANFCEPENTQR